MGKSAIVGSPNQRWVGYVATIAAALLSTFAVAIPAHSGDLYGGYDSRPYGAPYRYDHDSYRYAPEPTSYYHGAAYRPSCSPCGYGQCGYGGQCGCGWRCGPTVQRRGHVIERRWVEREYSERRYVTGGYYNNRPYGYGDSRWSGYPGNSGYGDSRWSGYPGNSGYGAPRPYLGYGGIQYQPSRASYEYEEPPRPPVGIPYYSDGYE